MIEKIGVIYQDANSLGFLKGLQSRLNCDAELISPPAPIGISQTLTRKQARNAWLYFCKKGVDLIVRFTDADTDRWQDIRRSELEVFPDEANATTVCGVAVDNTENWLALDPSYIAQALDIPEHELMNSAQQTGRIKSALT